MTIRTKTVEYAFPLATAAVATAVARDFTTITVTIPETTSRTFKSVHLEISAVDNVATAANVTAVLMGIQLNAIAIDSATVTQTITNSGENQSFLWTRDVTSYFVTNWTGTSMTALARLTVTGVATINATAKLVITYEYDDSATTQLKTVRIPIDGNTGNLTTGLANVGGVANQIPLLDEFLPEANKTIRSYFFQMDIHTGTTAAAAAALTMRYDGATSVTDTSWAYTLASDTFYRRIDVLTGLSTSATHSIEASTSSTTGAPFPCLNGVLVVTYTFDVVTNTTLNGAIDSAVTSVDVTDASAWPTVYPFTVQVDNEKLRVTGRTSNTLTVTRGFDGTTAAAHSTGAAVLATIMNSIMTTAVDESGWSGGTATGDKGRFKRNFLCAEPGLIELKQSGVQLFFSDAGVVTLDLRLGAQPSRTFAHAATVRCGGMSAMRRGDAGAVGGSGGTVTRGRNDFVCDYFTTSATAGNIGSNFSGWVFFNYTSGQSAPGGGDHNHSTAWMTLPYETGGNVQKKVKAAAGIKTPVIPETYYYLTGVSLWLACMTSGTAAANLAIAAHGEVQAAEGDGAGWEPLYSALYSSDAEIGPFLCVARSRTAFKRWVGDNSGGPLDIETARDYRFDCNVSAAIIFQAVNWVTYHTMTFSKVVNVTGSGGGSVTVNIRRAEFEPGTLLWTGSRTGDGTVMATLVDDIDTKFTEAREDDTHVGRSGNWT